MNLEADFLIMRKLDSSEFIGKTYGYLTIITDLGFIKKGTYTHRFVKAKCRCGTIKEYTLAKLRIGHTKSCGCIFTEMLVKRNTKHGGAKRNIDGVIMKNPLYSVWQGFKYRCYNKSNIEYHCYGGRGIIVCDEWVSDFTKFRNWALNNGYKKGLQIDRINNNGNYEPSNCRFVTSKINNRNRSNNSYVKYKGEEKLLIDLCEDLNISNDCVKQRIFKSGWDVEKAIITPITRGGGGDKKLNVEKVLDIRAKFASGTHRKVDLSKLYNVGHVTIIKVVNREIWKHI